MLADRPRPQADHREGRRWEKRWREALAEFSSEELATTAALLERLRAMYEQLD